MSGGPDRWGYTFPTSPSAQHLLSCSSNRCQSLTSSSTHPNARRHTPKSANQTANSCPKSHPCCSNCLNHTLHQSVPLSCSTMVTIRVCLVWVPSYAMPIFWSLTKIWHLFGWLPTISQPILVQLFGQSWPTHGLAKPSPIVWLTKSLVGQLWAQTKQPHHLLHLYLDIQPNICNMVMLNYVQEWSGYMMLVSGCILLPQSSFSWIIPTQQLILTQFIFSLGHSNSGPTLTQVSFSLDILNFASHSNIGQFFSWIIRTWPPTLTKFSFTLGSFELRSSFFLVSWFFYWITRTSQLSTCMNA